ncbi:DUF6236 family protein [Tumebacillus lipolyticus]|uniref:DUF6236 family protein n=1 Tax=Tumebacillus lipolyticus TaxID=1280370 RepID=A0ABW4ZZM6_9BACL
MPNIIYYPTISIPDRAWLKRTLLYSRQIGSIVPFGSDYFYKGLSNEPDIEYLINEGQFRAFNPQDFLYRGDFRLRENFEHEFFEFLTSPQYSLWKRRYGGFKRATKGSRTVLHNEKAKWIERRAVKNLIHESKLLPEVKEALESISKLSGVENDGWHEIDENIATVFVGLMAKYIGLEAGFTPATHSQVHEKILFDAINGDHDIAKPAIMVSLRNCLPTPAPHVSIRDIVAFKRNRKDELAHFLKELNAV